VPRGRPREFDPDEAVDRALVVFWARGYDGATLAELTAAMGLQRGSLYAAFGSKEALFGRVLERYGRTVGGYVARALVETTPRAVVEAALRGSVEATTGRDTPPGCLIVHGALVASAEAEPVRATLAEVRRADEAAVRARLEQLAAAGADLPAPAADLAAMTTALTAGLSVKARSGTTREQLHGVVDLTLKALWPRPDGGAPARPPSSAEAGPAPRT
jgi:AcrR family transcriptional regulator